MEIILPPTTSKEYIKVNRLAWRIHSERFFRTMVRNGIFGLVFLLLGINYSTINKEGYWNFFTLFGNGVLIFSLIYILGFFQQKERLFSQVDRIAKLYDQSGNSSEIILDENYVKIRTPLSYSSKLWACYTSHSFYLDYIILYEGSKRWGSLFIHKSDLTAEQLEWLKEFLKRKFPGKDISSPKKGVPKK